MAGKTVIIKEKFIRENGIVYRVFKIGNKRWQKVRTPYKNTPYKIIKSVEICQN